jgi:hypothetical protein
MLSSLQQHELIGIADFEIANHLCDSVPKYQSFADMHIKYANNETFKVLINEISMYAYAILGKDIFVERCWFNIARKDSDFKFHKHDTLTAVYYLKNCSGNGTIIKKDNYVFPLTCVDNSIQFVSADTIHSVPSWDGRDRYTLAFDLFTTE